MRLRDLRFDGALGLLAILSVQMLGPCVDCAHGQTLAFLDVLQRPLGVEPVPPLASPPAPAHPLPPARPEQPPAQPRATLPDRCLTLAELNDRDSDFDRPANRQVLSSPNVCMHKQVFTESGLQWTLQIIRNKENPAAFFWFVPHDNENVAIDTALYGMMRFGGTIVAVETGGRRFNGPQDPNRNFDAGTGRKCPQQRAASPVFTSQVMQWYQGAPIIALHSNEPGYSGDGRGGAGRISIRSPPGGSSAYPAAMPFRSRSPDDTMVFVASPRSRESDPAMAAFVRALNAQGINVIYERVSVDHNDCSLSNYAALKGIRKYVNIEVVHNDGAAQQALLQKIVPLLVSTGLAPSASAIQNAADSVSNAPEAPDEGTRAPGNADAPAVPPFDMQPPAAELRQPALPPSTKTAPPATPPRAKLAPAASTIKQDTASPKPALEAPVPAGPIPLAPIPPALVPAASAPAVPVPGPAVTFPLAGPSAPTATAGNDKPDPRLGQPPLPPPRAKPAGSGSKPPTASSTGPDARQGAESP